MVGLLGDGSSLVGVKLVSGVMLFSFFFLRLTKVVKCVVGMRAVFCPCVLNQLDSKLASLEIRREGLTWSRL